MLIVVMIAWLIRDHHTRLRVQGDRPITAFEVKEFLPETHQLKPDSGPRAGLFVFDKTGQQIGYAARTMPRSKNVIGYSGPTDGLIVLDAEDKVVGVSIRHSYDTPSHVEDVTLDLLFMESWNGRSWDEIAKIIELSEAGIYAVSGATRTSEALAKSVSFRMRVGTEAAGLEQKIAFRWQDAVLIVVLLGGCLFAFVKSKVVQKFRLGFSIFTILVFGFLLGDLLAQSLLVGWTESRVPWRETPGLVLLAAAMFVIPLFSAQPVYCQFVCPHGNLQRLFLKIRPASWMLKFNPDVKWVGRLVPIFLLLFVLVVSFFRLPIDLAGIEPFDAYLIRSAGLATLIVFGVSFVISFFVPMAYCKFGCPTGLLLEFIRKRGGKNSFQIRDAIGLGFLILAVIFHQTVS